MSSHRLVAFVAFGAHINVPTAPPLVRYIHRMKATMPLSPPLPMPPNGPHTAAQPGPAPESGLLLSLPDQIEMTMRQLNGLLVQEIDALKSALEDQRKQGSLLQEALNSQVEPDLRDDDRWQHHQQLLSTAAAHHLPSRAEEAGAQVQVMLSQPGVHARRLQVLLVEVRHHDLCPEDPRGTKRKRELAPNLKLRGVALEGHEVVVDETIGLGLPMGWKRVDLERRRKKSAKQ